MKKIFTNLLKHFLQGILLIVPLAITVYSVYYIFTTIDKVIPWFRTISPRIGFIAILLSITFFGYIGERFFLTRWLIDAIDFLFQRIPGIKFIYTSSKDVLGSFVGDKKKFNNPVWVLTSENPKIFRIGFLTQNVLSFEEMNDKVSVYLPHSYAISGWVIIVDKINVIPIKDMTSDQAMKFAISGGVSGLGNEKDLNQLTGDEPQEL